MLADESRPAFGGGFFSQLPQMIGGARAPARGVPHRASASRTTRSAPRAPRASSAASRRGSARCSCRSRSRSSTASARKLEAGAKVADVGCGAGVALLEMAKAFPRSTFHGYDISRHALARAEENRAAAGVANVAFHDARARCAARRRQLRLRHHVRLPARHDATRPAVMRAIRRAIRPDGTWLIADIKAQPTLRGERREEPDGGDDVRHLGADLHVVGAVGAGRRRPRHARVHAEPGARRWRAQAGFTRFRALDFGNPMNAFYEVRP